MRLQVFSVFDKAVQLYMPPIFLRSGNEAKRALAVALRGDHAFAQAPGDYALYRLGEFEEEAGLLVPCIPAEFVCELLSLVMKGE